MVGLRFLPQIYGEKMTKQDKIQKLIERIEKLEKEYVDLQTFNCVIDSLIERIEKLEEKKDKDDPK